MHFGDFLIRSPRIWNRMKGCKKFVWKSLNEIDSTVVLWRKIHRMETDDADDDMAMAKIDKLKQDKIVECDAPTELCEMDGERNLGDLHLAIVQAGDYIRKCECSFKDYKTLFKKACEKVDLDSIMENSQQLVSIREEQKSMRRTWRISVEGLSDAAHSVLQGIAICGQSPVTESIVNGILQARKNENESV